MGSYVDVFTYLAFNTATREDRTSVGANFSQGKLPALGWNSWNAFECDIDATKIITAANHMVNLGLKDLGYEYVNSMCFNW